MAKKTPKPKPPKSVVKGWPKAMALCVLSAALMFLGFAGFGIWPLAFVGIIPALYVFDPLLLSHSFDRPTGFRGFRRAWFFGYVAEFGGFYWLINTLVDFSGFPLPLCILFGSVFFLFQGLQFALVMMAFAFLRRLGLAATWALLIPFLASEQLFPMLFEHYYGNLFHHVPVLAQVAELGGPMMCTLLAIGTSGAIYDVLFHKWLSPRIAPTPIGLWSANSSRLKALFLIDGKATAIVGPSFMAVYLIFAIAFGMYRLGEVSARAARAPQIEVAMIQASVGTHEKFQNHQVGQRRHILQSREVIRAHPEVDLVVWPESALAVALPEGFDDARGLTGALGVPLLFGALRQGAVPRDPGARVPMHNTAFLADEAGVIQGSYDKTYLLAFGEYIPFGETFPQVYDISTASGRYTQGSHTRPFLYRHNPTGQEFRLSTLICYEDIVSTFVRGVVVENRPHLLVNITNDSWFGDTQEPWVHLALAKFRAIEHRRYLIRATNSGVSGIIDATGQLREHGGTFTRENIVGSVRMMDSPLTMYERLGSWPGWVSAGLLAILVGVARWQKRVRDTLARTKTPAN